MVSEPPLTQIDSASLSIEARQVAEGEHASTTHLPDDRIPGSCNGHLVGKLIVFGCVARRPRGRQRVRDERECTTEWTGVEAFSSVPKPSVK